MVLSKIGNPTLPSVPGGALAPQWKLGTQGNAPYFAQTIDAAVSNHVENHSDFSNHSDFRTSNHSGQSERLTSSGEAGLSTPGFDYVNTRYSSNYLGVVKNGSYVKSQSYYNYADTYVGNFDFTTPKNLFETTDAKS